MAISERNRAIFEGAGFDAIKLEVAFAGTRFNLAVPGVANQAKEWLVETEANMQQERQAALDLDRRRYNVMRVWTMIAAIAVASHRIGYLVAGRAWGFLPLSPS